MTFLSGFIVLLSVTVALALPSRFHAYRDTAFYNIYNPLLYPAGKPAVSNPKCFKDFSDLDFLAVYSIAIPKFRVTSPEHCNAICEQSRRPCVAFSYITGIPYGYGCNLYNDVYIAEIDPIRSGNLSCPAEKKECLEREVSYGKGERIAILKKYRSLYPRDFEKGVAGCQQFCANHNDTHNGFPHYHIDWKITDERLKMEYPNGRIPCQKFTFTTNGFYRGFCLTFTKNAIRTKVVKTAGPTPRCRNQKKTELQDAINNPNFHNVAGHVFEKTKSVGHLEEVIDPTKCQEECQRNNKCGKFQVIIGMPRYSGCHLFEGDANYERITVTSAEMNCRKGISECAQGVTNDATYGDEYEIVPRKEFEFKGHGIKDCERFCGRRSGKNAGFQFHEIDWKKTGQAINKVHPYVLKCFAWTFIDKPNFGKSCRFFVNGSRQFQLHYISATGIPSINAI